MGDKNKSKLSLGGKMKGAGGGSSSSSMTFRFSPDSEEIHEIKNPPSSLEGLSESVPNSPKPTRSGETSPLKEYIQKERHKWANKWEKKSLSLDLDIKGKIKTAMEEKNIKSLFSNFIPEENMSSSNTTPTTTNIPQSQSIPENISSRVYNSPGGISSEDSCSSSSTSSSGSVSINNNNNNNHAPSHTSSVSVKERSCASAPIPSGSLDKGSQETLDGQEQLKADEIGEEAMGMSSPAVEEVEVDKEEFLRDPPGGDKTLLKRFMTFALPAEEIQEIFDGLPTLYQPLGLLQGVRATPSDQVEGGPRGSSSEPDTQSIPGLPGQSVYSLTEVDSSEGAPAGAPPEGNEGEKAPQTADTRVAVLLITVLKSLILHKASKYWAAVLAANLILPLGPLSPLAWFLLGLLTMEVLSRGLTNNVILHETPSSSPPAKRRRESEVFGASPSDLKSFGGQLQRTRIPREIPFPSKSQGFMTELVGHTYDPVKCHFRQTRVVYVRLIEHNLYLLYPHLKHKIPKRRLWNDAKINTTHLFVKMMVFDISGADIKLVPKGMARRRAWNKKYPILITLPKYSLYHAVMPNGSMVDASAAAGAEKGKKQGERVNYSVTEGVTVSESSDELTASQQQITRFDGSQKKIYLFARCDREKDDWYRRFVNASRKGPNATAFVSKSHDPIHQYREFMKRMCPGMFPLAGSLQEGGYDNVSLYADLHVTDKAEQQSLSGSRKASPASSKKESPTKETRSRSADSSEFENIVTITQNPQFLNALIGRLLYEFLHSHGWTGKITQMIDKKLLYLRKPAWIPDICVKELDMGNSLPVILRASSPLLDFQGLWVDLDIEYEGSFNMALALHIDIMKLAKDRLLGEENLPNVPGEPGPSQPHGKEVIINAVNEIRSSLKVEGGETEDSRYSRIFDSEADDSGESSDDEDSQSEYERDRAGLDHVDPNIPPTNSKAHKMFQTIANSSLMKRGLVKKLVNQMALAPLVVSVELRACHGTITLNIPPPPNDRIWLGFRTNPVLDLKVKPVKWGETIININPVTEWIRRKILIEIQRAVVCPNLLDVTLPFLDFGIKMD